MKKQALYVLLFPLLLLFSCENCENTSINAEGKIKIKNQDTSENAVNINNVKIILSDSEESIIDTDIQIAPGIIKTFNLEANQYTVYVTSANNEKKYCQCIVNSGKTTYISWEKKEEMNNSYILYEVDGF